MDAGTPIEERRKTRRAVDLTTSTLRRRHGGFTISAWQRRLDSVEPDRTAAARRFRREIILRAAMAKHGHITDEDRALFRRATGDVRRMDDDRTPPVRTRRTPRPRSEAQSGEPGGSRGLAESGWASNVGPGDVLSFARGGVRRREIERLRRGRFKVEADLDLHGRTVAEAVAALDHFLQDSRRRGRRCVRIVHGKGFGSRSGMPIMKAHVDRWLRARSEVLAFCSATPPDGGTGALYVLLRR